MNKFVKGLKSAGLFGASAVLGLGLAVAIAMLFGWADRARADAQAVGGGCRFYSFQQTAQAEAQLGAQYAQGAQIISFWVDDKSSVPYNALVCHR